MPKLMPPIEHRFSSTNRPVYAPNAGHKGPYLTPLLKRLLAKKITFEDPETQKIIKGRVKDAIIWRYILNATQGETQAIEGILDRIDGKVNGGLNIDNSTHYHYTKMSDEELDNEIRKSYKDLFSKTSGRETPEKRE